MYSFIKNKTDLPKEYYINFINNFKKDASIYYAVLNTDSFVISAKERYENEIEKNNQLATKIQSMSNKSIPKKLLNHKMESDRIINVYKNDITNNNVKLNNVTAKGDYFAMNTNNVRIDGFRLVGNYSFDGCRNVEIYGANMLSKDSFWNTDNVTVYDSFISGEYLGWNAKNLTLINCTIESLQGMCYIDNLVMKNCKLINTTLAFEYSSVDADINSKIDSVMNPSSGIIRAEHIDNLILEKDKIDPSKTKIICEG